MALLEAKSDVNSTDKVRRTRLGRIDVDAEPFIDPLIDRRAMPNVLRRRWKKVPDRRPGGPPVSHQLSQRAQLSRAKPLIDS